MRAPAGAFRKAKPQPVASLDGVDGGANLFVRWALPVVGLDPGPANPPLTVEDEYRGVGNPIDLLPLVGRVAQTVAVDRPTLRIRQQGEPHVALAVRGDLLREIATPFGDVGTDRVNVDRFALVKELAKPGDLPGAVRSPISSVEYQDDFLASRRR